MSSLITSRRSFLTGLSLFIAAPAIVRAGNIMPVKQMLILPDKFSDITFPIEGFAQYSGRLIAKTTMTNKIGEWYSDEPTRLADLSSGRWRSNDNVMDDASERWERMKRREMIYRNHEWDGNPIT